MQDGEHAVVQCADRDESCVDLLILWLTYVVTTKHHAPESLFGSAHTHTGGAMTVRYCSLVACMKALCLAGLSCGSKMIVGSITVAP